MAGQPLSTSSVSVAPQTPVRRILALSTIVHRHVEIGVAIDVGVADAFEMREHRHARLRLHALDEALAAARHDDVDAAVEPCSIWPTAARSVVGTSWIAASGSPAAFRPATRRGVDGERWS